MTATTRKYLTRTRIEVIQTSLQLDEDSSKANWMESDYSEKLGFLSWSKNSNFYTTSPHSYLFVGKLKPSNYSPCSSLRDSLVERQTVGILITSQVLPAYP